MSRTPGARLIQSATPIWAPTGLGIAAVLLWGHRIAPAIFIAAVAGLHDQHCRALPRSEHRCSGEKPH